VNIMIFFALIIFLSAFLLFQIQPMIGRFILPWFGGTPAVWSTVMLFFQALLTGGYAYAYGLIARLGSRRQGIIHLILVGLSLGLLVCLGLAWPSPVTPGAGWKPQGVAFPIWDIFRILTVAVGLPYFVLAANAPLMQAWFSRAFPGRSPYRLYALSNLGSLLALVSYPILVEPWLALRAQGWAWAGGYLLFGLLAGYGSFRLAPAQASAPAGREAPAARPSPGLHLLWIALSACASLLLLAVTSQISQEVAVIPFLWVLPLTIYLLTFILAFSSERWYSRPLYSLLLLVFSAAVIWVLIEPLVNFALQIAIYCAFLFTACMICNGELVRLKPAPQHLTGFYLMTSIGGALGGVFVNLVAPLIFRGYWELLVGLAAAWVLLAVQSFLGETARLPRRLQFGYRTLLGSLAVAAVLFSGYYISGVFSEARLARRNFYGVIRVNEVNADDPALRAYAMIHGITQHGFQFTAAGKRGLTTTYYVESSGGGLAILNHPRAGQGLRVGVLGLGAGTLAAYGQSGDAYRFYEINPLVVELAEGQGGYFSFLADSRADVTVVLGDARLSLENELAAGERQDFDVLVLDTFSSDSIPVHLVTQEAFALYLEHLDAQGILAAHITNQHLDLQPVLWQLADHYRLSRVLIETPGDGVRAFRSIWMLLARDPSLLEIPAIARAAAPLEGYETPIRLWTDDYSNLFQILK
jgi:spermidine synthase